MMIVIMIMIMRKVSMHVTISSLALITCVLIRCASQSVTPIISSLKYSNILEEHAVTEPTPDRKFPHLEVLGFVTPWNANGQPVSLAEAEKGRLDVAVPVTWQMHPDGLAGGHDFSADYYHNLSEHGTHVYPRILFENWNTEQFSTLFHDPTPVVQPIVRLCKLHNFDGVVIEILQALLASGTMMYHHQHAVKLMRQVGEQLRQQQLKTVLVVLPYDRDVAQHGMSCATLQDVSKGYSRIVAMTYDYSTPGSPPGPMAPLPWVRRVAKYLSQECELWAKVLIGLNFYGVDFCDGCEDRHVVGHQVLQLLEEHAPEMMWWQSFGEHGFSYRSDNGHVVFYPTRQSIALRVALADEMGCGGVAAWDLGQGLAHFFEEF